MYQWNWKAITIHQGHVRRINEKIEALKESVELMASGAVDMQSLVSPYPLEEADQAFQDLINRKPGLYKAILVP
jgi:threonine dehydrogenase-like Zn-dependent dehydrogenase